VLESTLELSNEFFGRHDRVQVKVREFLRLRVRSLGLDFSELSKIGKS